MDLYKTEYNHLRGYINSLQQNISIVDIDFVERTTFNLEFDKNRFTLNPFDIFQLNISIYQKYFDLNLINLKEDMIHNLNIYDENNNLLNFTKKIDGSNVRYYISEELKDRKDKLYFLKDIKNNLSLNIYVNYDISKKIYMDHGENPLIENAIKYLNTNKISSNIYKTSNGLRVILLDRARNLSCENDLLDLININENLHGDSLYIKFIKIKNNYTMRLTPKFRHYKLIAPNEYEMYSKKFKEYLGVQNINKQEKYKDANNFIDELTKTYLKSNIFSVAKLIKNIGEVKDKNFLNFIDYHDKVTKALKGGSVLV